MLPIIEKDDGNKSVNETQTITPAANANEEIRIFLSVLLKNINILPNIVDKPAKAETNKLYATLLILFTIKIYELTNNFI